MIACKDMNDIDSAIARPGRLDIHIHVPLPNPESRKEILKGMLQQMPHSLSVQDIDLLVDKSSQWPSGDIVNLCREAAMSCIRSHQSLITISHFNVI